MTTNAKDEGIRAVREVRERISAECANDAKKLIEHYIEEQEQYSDRLLKPVAAQQDGASDDASRSR